MSASDDACPKHGGHCMSHLGHCRACDLDNANSMPEPLTRNGTTPDDHPAWQIAERLEKYYTLREAAVWLCSPHPQLEHITPAALIADDRAAEVHAVLDRLDSHVYL